VLFLNFGWLAGFSRVWHGCNSLWRN
jgi:hypothetical protein